MGKSAAANWAARWARGTVPNRANDPKRKVSLKNLVVTPHVGQFTGEPTLHVQDSSNPDDRGKYYSGYTKTEARRRHKEYLEGM